ncbi:MAG: DUF4861 family protein [Bacteroidales bacterium]|nr:DUF4861 family protein [Bacteroidales bacterium]
MKNSKFSGLILFAPLLLFSCDNIQNEYHITITNNQPINRLTETISIDKEKLGEIGINLFNNMFIYDVATDSQLITQHIDNNDDGIQDAILFQIQLNANETKKFILKPGNAISDTLTPEAIAYSRFVPERTDDYTWENDRVAFRTFGPEAQRMIEENIPGGTLTSGIDCWLKRVDYPIIEKWYAKHTLGTGSYHEDTGEGLDNFHVGASRGCGGIGVWNEKEKKLYTSDNFIQWKTLAGGYIRTMFQLTYSPWHANGNLVYETKRISLDLGSNLSKYEINAEGTDIISVGLTLHENDGVINYNKEEGWFSYWQPHGDSELGMGIVADPEIIESVTEIISDEADKSHLLVHLKLKNSSAVYYAGFGWEKSKQFNSREEWEEYLQRFVLQLKDPLTVDISR